MQDLAGMLGVFDKRPRSKVTVGFHRIGVVLAAPLLAAAAITAVWQWQDPSGSLVMVIPEGTLAWAFDEVDPIGAQLITEQRRTGLNPPSGTMVVGLPIETVRRSGLEWTKLQLPDGREIGIASTDKNKVSDVARDFLLSETKAGRAFTDEDTINFDGVGVMFLNVFDQFRPTEPPWPRKRTPDWTWALLWLSVGLAFYIVMRAIGWIVNGFVRGGTQPH